MTVGAIVAIAGDMHVNGMTALCPPAFNLDDGGTYRASKIQRFIWKHWLFYWQQVADEKERTGLPVIVILNGELADDLNHRSTQLITKNTADQIRLAVTALAPALDIADHILCTRGTEAHSGASACIDEIIAADIGAIPDDNGNHARWLLRTEIAGVRLHVAHHPGMGHARPWTRGGDANRIAASMIFRYVEQDMPPPDLAVFGHVHKPVDSGDNFSTRVIVQPSWQLSNAFGHRLGGDWLQLGASYFIIRDGNYEVRKCYTRPPVAKWAATKFSLMTN